jgi:hypothetical protein
MKALKLVVSLFSMLTIGAHAQTLSGLTLEPAAIKAGESVKATVQFENAQTPNCGIKIHWGDGQTVDAKINQTKDVPFVVSHTYAKAGNYNVMIEPKRVSEVLKCSGKNINKAVIVAAAPVVPAPASAPAPAASATTATASKPAAPCPEGWTLVKPGVNAKTKAFSCTAKPGTKIPEPKIACPGDLTYSENSKKGQLACRV